MISDLMGAMPPTAKRAEALHGIAWAGVGGRAVGRAGGGIAYVHHPGPDRFCLSRTKLRCGLRAAFRLGPCLRAARSRPVDGSVALDCGWPSPQTLTNPLRVFQGGSCLRNGPLASATTRRCASMMRAPLVDRAACCLACCLACCREQLQCIAQAIDWQIGRFATAPRPLYWGKHFPSVHVKTVETPWPVPWSWIWSPGSVRNSQMGTRLLCIVFAVLCTHEAVHGARVARAETPTRFEALAGVGAVSVGRWDAASCTGDGVRGTAAVVKPFGSLARVYADREQLQPSSAILGHAGPALAASLAFSPLRSRSQ
jgi:hypothetical protein